MKKLIFINLIFFLFSELAAGQTPEQQACLNAVIALEKKLDVSKDTALQRRNIYINYTVKATNQENETVVSHVKLFKKENYVHFFSEQAVIYMDEKEALIAVPSQKLLILNSLTKELLSKRRSDDFFELRMAFLEACIVSSCNTNEDITTVQLKVDPRADIQGVFIRQITYVYNSRLNKVLSVTMNYSEDYALSRLEMIYGDVDLESKHKFGPARTMAMNKRGELIERYREYELVDNRDKGTYKKHK